MRAPAAAAPRAAAASWPHDQATALSAVLAAWSVLAEQKQPPPQLEDVYSSRVSRHRRPGSYSDIKHHRRSLLAAAIVRLKELDTVLKTGT